MCELETKRQNFAGIYLMKQKDYPVYTSEKFKMFLHCFKERNRGGTKNFRVWLNAESVEKLQRVLSAVDVSINETHHDLSGLVL